MFKNNLTRLAVWLGACLVGYFWFTGVALFLIGEPYWIWGMNVILIMGYNFIWWSFDSVLMPQKILDI